MQTFSTHSSPFVFFSHSSIPLDAPYLSFSDNGVNSTKPCDLVALVTIGLFPLKTHVGHHSPAPLRSGRYRTLALATEIQAEVGSCFRVDLPGAPASLTSKGACVVMEPLSAWAAESVTPTCSVNEWETELGSLICEGFRLRAAITITSHCPLDYCTWCNYWCVFPNTTAESASFINPCWNPSAFLSEIFLEDSLHQVHRLASESCLCVFLTGPLRSKVSGANAHLPFGGGDLTIYGDTGPPSIQTWHCACWGGHSIQWTHGGQRSLGGLTRIHKGKHFHHFEET